MAKRKTKFHKTVIHPNRWLIWTIAIAVIVTIGLASYIYISSIQQDTAETVNENPAFWHTYKDTNLTFHYPAEWLIDPGTGYVGFGTKTQDSFLVYSYSANDSAYENYLKYPGIRQITVDGRSGIRIIDTSTKNYQHIAFVKDGKRLYEFRGATPLFDKILATIRFLK